MSPAKVLQHAALLLGLSALNTGCYAGVTTEPAYVETSAPPPAYETAPSYYYEGHPVYYVDGHWYARDHDHWRYYREEPPTLYRRRVHVQEAPRVRSHFREEYREHRAPELMGPRHEMAQPRNEAPDAVRVR